MRNQNFLAEFEELCPFILISLRNNGEQSITLRVLAQILSKLRCNLGDVFKK